MRRQGRLRRGSAACGFSLIEVLVVILLLAIAMLGILAVFDASARINKSEQQVADAQGAVRYGVYQMTKAIRMAGSGGLFLTQAVLNRPDPSPNLPGINGIACADSKCQGYDNVPAGVTVTALVGGPVPVRPNTDMIEVRGVLFSPLVSFDLSNGCGGCTGVPVLKTAKITGQPEIGEHYNDDPTNRPQFAAIDAYTAKAATDPFFVIVSANDDIHGGCSTPFGRQQFAQPSYNVGLINLPTDLVASNTFGSVNFADAKATEFNNENPFDGGTAAGAITNVRRAGILDDVIYFIDDTDPNHPALDQGIRRGAAFDVTTIADDVEDMQIAYGVDLNGDNAVTRTGVVGGRDTDLNTSTVKDQDEWAPNVTGETPWSTIQFQAQQLPDPGTFPHPGLPAAAHCPRLHGVMIALVARSKDPDPTYRAPSAFGLNTMNAPTPAATTTRYRRRVQMLRINLRNYSVNQ